MQLNIELDSSDTLPCCIFEEKPIKERNSDDSLHENKSQVNSNVKVKFEVDDSYPIIDVDTESEKHKELSHTETEIDLTFQDDIKEQPI